MKLDLPGLAGVCEDPAEAQIPEEMLGDVVAHVQVVGVDRAVDAIVALKGIGARAGIAGAQLSFRENQVVYDDKLSLLDVLIFVRCGLVPGVAPAVADAEEVADVPAFGHDVDAGLMDHRRALFELDADPVHADLDAALHIKDVLHEAVVAEHAVVEDAAQIPLWVLVLDDGIELFLCEEHVPRHARMRGGVLLDRLQDLVALVVERVISPLKLLRGLAPVVQGIDHVVARTEVAFQEPCHGLDIFGAVVEVGAGRRERAVVGPGEDLFEVGPGFGDRDHAVIRVNDVLQGVAVDDRRVVLLERGGAVIRRGIEQGTFGGIIGPALRAVLPSITDQVFVVLQPLGEARGPVFDAAVILADDPVVVIGVREVGRVKAVARCDDHIVQEPRHPRDALDGVIRVIEVAIGHLELEHLIEELKVVEGGPDADLVGTRHAGLGDIVLAVHVIQAVDSLVELEGGDLQFDLRPCAGRGYGVLIPVFHRQAVEDLADLRPVGERLPGVDEVKVGVNREVRAALQALQIILVLAPLAA